MKKDEFKHTSITKLEISYLQAGIYLKVILTYITHNKEIVNMLSRKDKTMCEDDDVAAKLLVNNIFGGNLTSKNQ
jgi:hypothetical protein